MTSNGKDIEKIFDEKANSSQIFIEKVAEYIKKQSYVDTIYKSNFFNEYKFNDFCY